MAVELWSANHVSAPPEATFTAPSVHDLPAGTVGAEVGLAETPRQSLSGVEVHGMFFASSIFWLARNVAVDVWLPPWTVPGFTNHPGGIVPPPSRTAGQLYVSGALPMSSVSTFVDDVSSRFVEMTAPLMLPPPAPCSVTSFCA